MNSQISDEQFFGDLRSTIITGLTTGELTIDYCASKLGVSRRTLQRRSSEHSVNFRSIVEDVRKKLSAQLLADGDLTISEIALQLGYSCPSNFSRAFQRMTGMSPSTFRSRFNPIK